MFKNYVITSETFEMLLSWLDQNRDSAAQKYEKIRARLIRIFIGRGCFEAENLADETINRVICKMPQLAETYSGEPALYFYGVAEKLYLEWFRKSKKISYIELSENGKYGLIQAEQTDIDSDSDFQCLQKCLQTLSVSHREIIIEYYRGEKREKIERRKQLGKQLGISDTALQIKTSRIRTRLKVCINRCLTEK